MHIVLLTPSGSTSSLLLQQSKQQQHPSNRSSSTASGQKTSSTFSATAIAAAAANTAEDFEQHQLRLLPSPLLQDLQARVDVHVAAMPSSSEPDGAKLSCNKPSGAKTRLGTNKPGGAVKAAGALMAIQVPLTTPAAGGRTETAAAPSQVAGAVDTSSGGSSLLPMRELLDLALTRLRQSKHKQGKVRGRAEEEASAPFLPSSSSRLPPLLLLRACIQRSSAATGGGCATTTYSELEMDAEALLIEGAIEESFQEYRKRCGGVEGPVRLPLGRGVGG